MTLQEIANQFGQKFANRVDGDLRFNEMQDFWLSHFRALLEEMKEEVLKKAYEKDAGITGISRRIAFIEAFGIISKYIE